MKQLGIESWRNLSKEKAMQLVSMLPDMDTELALRIIDQFPAFKEFALEAINQIEKAHESTLAANEVSQDQFRTTLADIREVFKGELAKDDLTWEQRRWILEQIQDHGRMAFQKDSENKRFLDTILGKVALAGVGAIALGLVFVGARATLDQGGSTNSNGA